MTGIILAAGNSKRLKPITDTIPKCLLDISGKCVLGRQLESLQKAGITKVFVVVGFMKQQIIDYCKDIPGMDITIVENEDWENNNNAKSLLMALNNMEPNDFIFMNADTIWYGDLLKDLVDSDLCENLLAYKRKPQYPEEDMKIVVNNEDRAETVSKTEIHSDSADGEFMGIAKFSVVAFGLLREYLQRCDENDWFERAVQDFLDAKVFPVCGLDISHYPCMEIDFPEDLDKAREYFPYNDPVWEQGQRHGTPFDQEEAFRLLSDITDLLNRHGIESYLNWGCLLGIYRDNQFIPWDTDIDITCFWENRKKILDLIPEMQKLGCFIPDPKLCYPEDFWIIREGEKIELNFVESINDKYVYSPSRSHLASPKDLITPFKKHKFRDQYFNIPNKTEEYLAKSYGINWKTPIKGKKPVSI